MTQRGRECVVARDERRAILVLMAAEDEEQTLQLRHMLDWPVWEAPAAPPPTHEWHAVFNTSGHAFEGLSKSTGDDGHPAVVKMRKPPVLTGQTWQMLTKAPCAVLAVGLTGQPTPAEIGSAAGTRRLRAVLAPALMW